ncbi:MAG: AMP-binding protein [Spirochaetales bacterium]|jgi:acetyl-CoA synthetase|nr:AMP-binding protein [Spirochaetales bacterium]
MPARDWFCSGDFKSYEDLCRNFSIRVPDNFNFAFDVVDRLGKEEPGRTALVWCDDHGRERTFTFKEMAELSSAAAWFFQKQGIRKGDRVMLILKRRYQFWYALLGLHKVGAIAIPATHQLTRKDIIYRVNAAGIKMILAAADSRLAGEIEAARPSSPELSLRACADGEMEGWINFDRELESLSREFPRSGDSAGGGEDLSLLYFTSGTTGYPKMVTHNFLYPLGHIVTAAFWQNAADGGLHLTVSDTGWAKSVWGKIYGQWLCGAAVMAYDMDSFVPAKLLKVMADKKVTSFCAPPTIYRFLIQEDLSRYDLSHLNYCAVAGEPLNPEVYNRFYELLGLKLYEGFGQTELTVVIGTFTGMEPKPGSMGLPAPGYDVRVLAPDGSPCELGDVGEICIDTSRRRPLGFFSGYYRDEAMTKSVYSDNLYRTGDTAWVDEDGYFWFVGRTDDIIKSSGYRIGPFEVESALLEHPGVLECAITGTPDPTRGQAVKATVVLKGGYRPSQELIKELQDHVKRVTAPYKYPRVIEFVDELPKTISGKIRRVEIREHDGGKND